MSKIPVVINMYSVHEIEEKNAVNSGGSSSSGISARPKKIDDK